MAEPARTLRLGQLLVGMVMFVMISASLLKAADIGAFQDVLRTQWLVPCSMASVLALAIPTAELMVGIAWFIGIRPRSAIILGGALITLFTAAFVWLWLMRAPPDCACFGKIKVFQQNQHNAYLTVIRNSCLLVMLAVGAALTWRHPTPPTVGTTGPSHAKSLHAH